MPATNMKQVLLSQTNTLIKLITVILAASCGFEVLFACFLGF